MYSFRNDYSEGAHPKVLEALTETNLTQTVGYGLDPFCEEAAITIRRLCNAPEADVHFLVGGTQANLITIAAHLRPYEAAIAAHTGHINVHETGAIEAAGHKVCTACSPDGKLTPELVESVLRAHSTEHMVSPRLVYISDTTEIGTVYTKAELTALRRCCDDYGLFLYLDGARLGSALTAEGNDLTLPDLAALTDAFTIGGTKVGFLFGEAIVLTDEGINDCFRYHIKQRGGMLAKGRLLGVQFEAMLENGYYTRLAARANDLAQELKRAFVDHGCALFSDTAANQIFPILPDEAARRLATGYAFSFWERVDDTHQAVRFCTNVTTDRADVDALLRDIDRAF